MKTKSLGELVEIRGGGTPSRRNASYWGSDIPWATVKDLQGTILSSTIESITQEGVGNSATNIIPAGTVIMATRMALGRAAINTVDMAINQDLKALICTSSIEPRFLLHFINANAQGMESQGKGATVKGITLDFLRAMQVPDYSSEEQKRIAAILDKADAICRKRAGALRLADDFLKSVFLYLVGTGAMGYERWHEMSISELVATHRGAIRTGPFGSNLRHSEFVDEGIAVLGIDNAVNNRFEWAQRRFITAEKYEELKQYTVFPGDVIITIMGTTGRTAVVPENIPTAISTKHLATITPNRQLVYPQFIAFSVRENREVLHQIAMLSKGAIMDGLNLTIIKGLRLRVPPLDVQAQFEALVKRTEQARSRLLHLQDEAATLFGSLVQRAFRGEL